MLAAVSFELFLHHLLLLVYYIYYVPEVSTYYTVVSIIAGVQQLAAERESSREQRSLVARY